MKLTTSRLRPILPFLSAFLFCTLAIFSPNSLAQEGSGSETFVPEGVIMLLEDEYKELVSPWLEGRTTTYSTEKQQVKTLEAIAKTQQLSNKMDLLLIQQNNRIIQLLEELVKLGRDGKVD